MFVKGLASADTISSYYLSFCPEMSSSSHNRLVYYPHSYNQGLVDICNDHVTAGIGRPFEEGSHTLTWGFYYLEIPSRGLELATLPLVPHSFLFRVTTIKVLKLKDVSISSAAVLKTR